MVAVFIPGLKETFRATLPDHQSHAVLPGRIQEVSAIALGGFKLTTMLDSTRRPAWSPIIRTRQGERTGVCAETASPGSSARGASFASSVRASRPRLRYMPA